MEASTSSAQVFPVNWGIKYLNRFIFSTTRYTVSDEGKAAKAEAQRVPGISKKGSRWNFNSFPKFRKKKKWRFKDTVSRTPFENYWARHLGLNSLKILKTVGTRREMLAPEISEFQTGFRLIATSWKVARF